MPFDHDGIWKKIREVYTKPRDAVRIKEMEELCRDVDYLISEIQHVEKRMGVTALIPVMLRDLCIQLRYYEERRHYKSDLEFYDKLAEEFKMDPVRVRKIVYDTQVLDTWWLTEEEGGHEPQPDEEEE